MNRIVNQIARKALINAAVRVPLKICLGRSSNRFIKSLLYRVPVVGKFSVKLPDGNSIIIDTPGPEVDPMGRKLFWWGFASHEAATAKVFYELAKNCGTIFDVGANIGYFSLLADAANKSCRIVAFEPAPQIFKCLKRNIELNHATNVIAVSAAVTSRDGCVILYVDQGVTSSIIKGFRSAVDEIEVPSVNLDSFVRENNITRVDLIKIDVEKGEPQVLEGMKEILRRDAPDIICEVLGSTDKTLTRLLSHHGYRYYWITDEGLIRKDSIVHDNRYHYLNYLFTKS